LGSLFAGLTLAAPVDIARRGSKFSEVDITILQFALTVCSKSSLIVVRAPVNNFFLARTP
jgi:hypothetical protein